MLYMNQKRTTQTITVPTMLLGVVCICLCLAQLSVAEDTSDRLARVEAILAEVLEKNVKLQQRLAHVEEENVKMEQRLAKVEEENGLLKKTNELFKKRMEQFDDNEENSDETKKTTGNLNIYGKTQPLEKRASKRFVSDFQGSSVAFTAVVSPPQIINLGAGQPVIYDQTITNVGGAYHNGSGMFTAPVGGVYVFNYAVMIDPGFDEYIELVKNGVHVIWNYGHATGSNHLVSASRTATVELSQGDQVWIQTQRSSTHGDGIIHGNGFTTFSGWLITLYE